MPESIYIGRFAPSPTGPLHFGSLFTALASFLDAKHHQGLWLLRIDDLDTARNIPGADSAIMSTLDAFGLHWDRSVSYQSQSLAAYNEALHALYTQNLVYRCICSRKTLASIETGEESESVYPNYCRHQNIAESVPAALRLKTTEITLDFNDLLQGNITADLASEQGDFIIKRKDQVIAYQFAVVIDDYLQNINHVLRGADLLTSTIKQIYLHQCLHLPIPIYLHVPLITGANGSKLSKKEFAPAVTKNNSHETLFTLLQLLRQNPPVELRNETIVEQLKWAIVHWDRTKLISVKAIEINATV